MRPDPSSPSPDRVPTRRRILKLPRRRALALAGALSVLSLTAAACGGGDSGGTAQTQTADAEAVAAEPALSSDFIGPPGPEPASRRRAAIRKRSRATTPASRPAAPTPSSSPTWGANLAELDTIGLEAIVVEEPGLIIDAYTNEVNFNGGINGRCVKFVPHLYSLTDPVASFTQICTDLLTQKPIFYMSLRLTDPVVQCATIGGQIPTIGLYAFASSAALEQTGDRVYLDDGTVEHLLSASLDVALSSRVINANSPIGLLHGSATAGMDISEPEAIIASFGLNLAAAADVPTVFSDLQLLLLEKRVRLLEGGLSDDEAAEAQRNLATLPPEAADLFGQIEQFYLEAANRFKDAGVTAVAASADWTDVRRMMRAAELVDWYPTWIANDIQPATIVLADVPKAQAENLVLVSNRRAAGDEVPALDQGCITLRNTASTASPFAHRLHTDAWTLITATCDYLDVAFSAMTRVQGDITADTFVEAIQDTRYDTPYGGLITFAPADPNGSERFRVLQADPECVLNFWGCMRSTTDWLTPANTVGASAG